MKNSLALVITENDRSHIRTIYGSKNSLLNEQTFTPPAELDTKDKIIAFQKYMNGEDPKWFNGGTLPEKDMGTYGVATNGVWPSYKDAFLVRLNANNNANNSGGSNKVEDGWYYYKDGKQMGPVKLSDLSGQLDDKTYVWNSKVTSGWVKSTDNSVQSQLGDIVGPPKFQEPVKPKTSSESDNLLKSQQKNYNYELNQKPQNSTITVTNPQSNSTTNSTTTNTSTTTDVNENDTKQKDANNFYCNYLVDGVIKNEASRYNGFTWDEYVLAHNLSDEQVEIAKKSCK